MFKNDYAIRGSLKKSQRRLYLLGVLIGIIGLFGLSACEETGAGTGIEEFNIARYEAELTAAQRLQRYTMMRDSLRTRGIEGAGFLFGGIANSETNLAHCWDEATWACQGPNSVDCGGRPVIAGAGDGPCHLQEGGLGLFQFDAGTFADTLRVYGASVLTIDGQMHHVLNFVTNMLRNSVYVPSVTTTAQAMDWMNAFNPYDAAQRTAWIQTVTRYYNGCQPNWSCWGPRIGTYTDGFWRAIDDVGGLEFWSAGSSVGTPSTPSSLTSNGTISAVNWAGNQHSEVWVRGQNGALHHAWTHADANWSALHSTGAEASCGFAATHWPTDPDYIETFFPRSSGDSGHLWFNSEWQGPGNFGGAGFKEFSTLLWPNGHNEVFALAPDGAIYHRFWLAGDHAWSDWYNFSGGITFKTGASPIVWGDGRPEVFATDADGYVWSRWWRPDENAWSDWTRSFGDAKMASRPIPVRWQSGRLEIFAQGVDGYLYHSWFLDHQWANLQRLGDRKIQGEPSAIFNPSGNGGPFGPQVFARDENNRLFEIHMENGAWVEFRPLLADRVLAAEPFAWVRRDGVAMLFAVDANGDLIESHRDKTQGWQPWSVIGGAKVDDCSAPDEPPPGDSGPGDDPGDDPDDDPGAGSGNDPGDDPGAGSGDEPGDDPGAGSGNDPGDDPDDDPYFGDDPGVGGGLFPDAGPGGNLDGEHFGAEGGCNAAPGADAGWLALILIALGRRMRRVEAA